MANTIGRAEKLVQLKADNLAVRNVLKKIGIVCIWFNCIVLLIALLKYLSSEPDAGFVNTLTETYILFLSAAGIVAAIWIVFYYPLIFSIRRWWQVYRKTKKFSNPQTPRFISRFLFNTGAMFGALTLLYAAIIFITAHLIAPDPTPHAGFQVNEIPYKSPGFRVQVLEVPLERTSAPTGFFAWLVAGKKVQYRLIPIKQYWFTDDSVFVERYLDANIPGDIQSYPVQFICGDKQINHSDAYKEIETKKIYTRYYWFGTDDLGRDYLSRILLGVRVSLAVGFVAVIIALLIGIPIGAVAGFFKKVPPHITIANRKIRLPVDGLLMWMMSVIWAIPAL
ncbi:MAG: hypothetical protein ACK4IY_08445, partial [Chitinophagales bacterium]